MTHNLSSEGECFFSEIVFECAVLNYPVGSPEYLGQTVLRSGCSDDMHVVSHQAIAEHIQLVFLAIFL